MIDHVSIGVRDLASATVFYTGLLQVLGHQILANEPATVGFGKKYPEFWLNSRPNKTPGTDDGCHICLRAANAETVDLFHAKALELGAFSSGEPGRRPHYHASYYAAFVLDADHNHIEVVSFIPEP